MSTYVCLSVRAPWAWLLINGIKDIENRNQKALFRGTIALHSSKSNLKGEYAAALELIKNRGLDVELPPLEQLPIGGIVGLIDLMDCTESSDSPWYIPGNYAWHMANPQPGPFVPQQGQLGFFKVQYAMEPLLITEPPPLPVAPPAKRRFGTCHKCQGAIVIPGLDRFNCENCGWIARPKLAVNTSFIL